MQRRRTTEFKLICLKPNFWHNYQPHWYSSSCCINIHQILPQTAYLRCFFLNFRSLMEMNLSYLSEISSSPSLAAFKWDDRSSCDWSLVKLLTIPHTNNVFSHSSTQLLLIALSCAWFAPVPEVTKTEKKKRKKNAAYAHLCLHQGILICYCVCTLFPEKQPFISFLWYIMTELE